MLTRWVAIITGSLRLMPIWGGISGRPDWMRHHPGARPIGLYAAARVSRLGLPGALGRYTIYHTGDCVPYEGLAAQVAEQDRAEWLAPMHYDTFRASAVDVNGFIEHLLERYPAQCFKVFKCDEGWLSPVGRGAMMPVHGRSYRGR
jgi:hypothetical protein